MKNVFEGPDLKVIFDSDEIYPDDPGRGTPLLVELANGDTGTYECVTTEGETADGTRLSKKQLDFLNSLNDTLQDLMSQYIRKK